MHPRAQCRAADHAAGAHDFTRSMAAWGMGQVAAPRALKAAFLFGWDGLCDGALLLPGRRPDGPTQPLLDVPATPPRAAPQRPLWRDLSASVACSEHGVTSDYTGPHRATQGHTGPHRATQGHTGPHEGHTGPHEGHTGPHEGHTELQSISGLCRILTRITGMQEQVGYNVRAATGNKFFPAPQCQEGRFWVKLLSQLYSRVIHHWSGYNRILTVPRVVSSC